jgi:hypothetical protein
MEIPTGHPSTVQSGRLICGRPPRPAGAVSAKALLRKLPTVSGALFSKGAIPGADGNTTTLSPIRSIKFSVNSLRKARASVACSSVT